MRKISILKAETFESIVEKIKNSSDKDVVLRVPRGSILAEDSKRLRALKKELKNTGKNLSIESVDDQILEFASRAGIEAFNPFFSKKNQISDIVAPGSKPRTMIEVLARAEKPALDVTKEASTPKPVDITPPQPKPVQEEENVNGIPWTDTPHGKRRVSVRALVLIGIILAIIIGGAIFWTVFARADITIVRETYLWAYNGRVAVDPSVKTLNSSAMKIPGELFSIKNTFEDRFAASGTKTLEQKATGTITIYNAYNTSPTFLIKNTRFEAPDGKIFRLLQNVTVPGGKTVSGKSIPGSIDAGVIADKAGEAYNIPATPKFTIPGFAGTPKFQGFYGASKQAMTGGFVGTVAYPTPDDIAKAQSTFEQTSAAALTDRLINQIPKALTQVSGSRAFRFLSETVDTIAGADKKFGMKGEGELRVVAFRESDVSSLLGNLGLASVGSDKELLSSNISYGTGQFTASSSSLFVLPVVATSTFVETIDTTSFKNLVVGKSKDELGKLGVTGVTNIRVSISPFWVSRVPKDAKRVSIYFK